MAVYLNSYSRYQAYGGPHEGGWFYEVGTPLQSVLYSHEDYDTWCDKQDWDQLREVAKKATYAYTEGREPKPIKNGTGGYTFMPGSDVPSDYRMSDDIYSCFEDHFAEEYPQEKPIYC